MEVRNVLNGHKLFSMLGLDCISKISRFAAEKSYDKGATVYVHGEVVTHVFLSLEGAVQLRLPPRDGAGQSLVISNVSKGELFGVSSLVGIPRHPVTAAAVEPSDVLAIEARPFLELLQEDRRAGFHVITHVAEVYFNRYLGVLRQLQSVVEQIPIVR